MHQKRGEVERARRDATQAQVIFEECYAARDLGKAAVLLEELG
jgi:hypothetical protein